MDTRCPSREDFLLAGGKEPSGLLTGTQRDVQCDWVQGSLSMRLHVLSCGGPLTT